LDIADADAAGFGMRLGHPSSPDTAFPDTAGSEIQAGYSDHIFYQTAMLCVTMDSARAAGRAVKKPCSNYSIIFAVSGERYIASFWIMV
jgi:hypothetical protein